ncbi:hypothetical protein C2869_16260 [Saccharobesus litoralis]|uniref:Lipoprotein n=1 Tax=Saccharobesus litoralis TaxID=2172099 RepID=A0A2S0VUI8_9ALTE|nr:hypothetical protein [Saccharobesus litoralis]AWB67881.1 hypothetical protein C2869_16260 [Saccharobesus litoralis]
MKKLGKLLVATSIFTLLAGCKSTPESTVINLQPTNTTKTLTFKKLDGDAANVVTLNSVKQAVVQHVKATSGFAHCDTSPRECNKKQNKGFEGVYNKWGRKVYINENQISLKYFNTEYTYNRGSSSPFGGSTSEYTSTIDTAFPYTISETADAFTVTIKSPANATTNKVRNPIFLPVGLPLKTSRVQELVNDVLELDTAETIPITHYVKKSGEFNVEYAPESVKANYVREYGDLGWNKASAGFLKSGRENVTSNGQSGNFELKIHLYRGNSKVEFDIKQQIKVLNNGTVQYDNGAFTKQIAEKLEQVAKS